MSGHRTEVSRLSSLGVPAAWNVYANERDELLERITELLLWDRRMAAAWLFGSLGRGEEDHLSDLDIWAVVEDDHITDFITESPRTADLAGPHLFVVEAPQNAPRGGAYRMVCYDAPTAPHLVDWYWQARSQAIIPRQTRLLFDRAGLPRSNESTPPGQGTAQERSPTDAASQAIRFFWAMLMITAKYAARNPFDNKMSLAPYVLGPLREVSLFTGDQNAPLELPVHSSPDQKLTALTLLADTMSGLLPAATACGARIPDGADERVRRYLDLVAPVLSAPADRSGRPDGTAGASGIVTEYDPT